MYQKILRNPIASSLIVLCLLMFSGIRAQALDMTPVTSAVPVTDVLETGDAVKYYSFTMEQAGYFTISLAPVDDGDLSQGWNMELYDDADKMIKDYIGIKSETTSEKFGYQAGSKFYVKVSCKNTRYCPAGKRYQFVFHATVTSDWEQEANDEPAYATPISPNTTYYGKLLSKHDVDYFSYTVTADGSQTFTFGPSDMTVSNFGWRIEFYDAANLTYLFGYTAKSQETYPTVDFAKGTKLLIKIKTDNSSSAPETYYALCVNEKASDRWEQENRITSAAGWASFKNSATPMVCNETYNGTIWQKADEDLYKLSLKKTGILNLVFVPDALASSLGKGYHLTLLNASGKELQKYSSVTSRLSNKIYLKAGTYYVKLEGERQNSEVVNVIYSLTANFSEYAPAKVASVKASKNKISWKKQGQVDGYEVSYALKSSFSGAKKSTTTKNNIKLSLKKGKTYYIRVRAYKTTLTNNKIYGPFSKAVKTTIKKTK